MLKPPIIDEAFALLARALAAGAVVELAGRALVQVARPGIVTPGDRTGAWPAFAAEAPGIYACCPLVPALPAAIVAPAARAWLHLGEPDEVEDLLPVAEWLAATGKDQLRAFTVGLLHGLAQLAEAGLPVRETRPVIRTPESLARALFG